MHQHQYSVLSIGIDRVLMVLRVFVLLVLTVLVLIVLVLISIDGIGIEVLM
jgi:hypothetical protein